VLLTLLAPIAPHITEELWHRRGNETSIHLEAWPQADPEVAAEDTVTLVVQVNGKVRDRIEVAADADEESAVAAEKACGDALVFENRVVEIAQDRRLAGLRPRQGVVRTGPCPIFALVAVGAGLRAHIVRYGLGGLGRTGGCAEGKKTRYGHETANKTLHPAFLKRLISGEVTGAERDLNSNFKGKSPPKSSRKHLFKSDFEQSEPSSRLGNRGSPVN
jgi:hypothetical protein